MKRNVKIALVVLAIVLVILALIVFVVIPSPQNIMQKDLESCEKTATIGTYTITTLITTQVSGTNTTFSLTTVTTQQQICTVSP